VAARMSSIHTDAAQIVRDAPLDINLADAHTYIYASPWNMEVRVYVCHDTAKHEFVFLLNAPLDINLADAHTYINASPWKMEVRVYVCHDAENYKIFFFSMLL